jgi:hypothetical protein
MRHRARYPLQRRRAGGATPDLERDDIAIAQPSRSNCSFDRVIQIFGDSAYSHHALAGHSLRRHA